MISEPAKRAAEICGLSDNSISLFSERLFPVVMKKTVEFSETNPSQIVAFHKICEYFLESAIVS